MQKTHYIVLGALILIALCIGFAGCASLGHAATQSARAEAPSYPSAADAKVSYSGNGAAFIGEQGLAMPAPTSAPTSAPYSPDSYTGTDQKIIRTAYVTIEVTNVSGTMETLKTLATAGGGYLSSSSINRGSSDRMYASVVMRIPAAGFEQVMTQLKSVGTVTSSQISADDVTEEYVDLNAQKTALTNELDQFNKILAKATTVEDTLKVQVEIGKVQTNLDRIEGRLKYLNNRIDFSTITVNLQEPEPIGSGVTHDFNSVINEGIAGFLGMIDSLIIIAFAVLPLVVIGGIVYLVYRWHKSRKGAVPPDSADVVSPPEQK
ncbi:MAG: DUF4349 domain-containing protein [Methanoregulaceae archaeon]